MEDKQETLKEYGIEENKWTDKIGIAASNEKEEVDPQLDPTKEEFDPYLLVAETVKKLEIEDLATGKMVINKSLSESMQKREALVRNHFSTYVKCRELLKEMAEIQKKIKQTGALEKAKEVLKLEHILASIHKENKEIEKRKKQVEFFNKNRVLFDGPDILEEHLLLLDFQSFLSSYKQAKAIFEKYRNSKFISYLWSKFVQVLQRFKSEIGKRIEDSQCITESIHYLNIYIQIDPDSAARTFGTFLVIAKKEFYASMERLQKHQKEKPSAFPEKALACFVDEQLEHFLFMVRSMDAVELIYNQEKHMHDFISSGIDAFAHIVVKAVDVLFSTYLEDSSSYNVNLPSAIKEIFENIKKFGRKVETSSTSDIFTHPHLTSLHIRLLSLLWAKTHTFSQEQILSQYSFTLSTFTTPKEIFKQVKKAIKMKLDFFDSLPSDRALKEVCVIRQKTIPEIEKTSIESFSSLNTEIDVKEAYFVSKMALALKKSLSKAATDEEFLMKILHVRVSLIHAEVNTFQEYTKVVLQALDNRTLTPVQQHYLAKIYKNSTSFSEEVNTVQAEDKKAILSLSKQLQLLTM